MTSPSAPPAHMSRERFSPSVELRQAAAEKSLPRVTTMFGSAWLATHYQDVRAILSNSAVFSNARPVATQPVVSVDNAGNLLASDPPEHTRLRRMLTPEFTIRRMRRIEPRVAEIIADHLDAMAKAGSPAELVASFALPVPSLVICELLGVPYADRAEFQSRTTVLLDFSTSMQQRTNASVEMRDYMNELVGRQRAEPGEDLLGMLVREHGDELPDSELSGIAQLLLVAGHETTSNMLGMGTLLLLENPEQLALLRDNPELVDDGVEELLRYLSVVHSGVPRLAVTEVTMQGQRIDPGELIFCSLPMANRDPTLIAEGDRLDVTRTATRHVAFGHGIHHCLGAPLARMEMRIGFPALLRRFPGLRLAIPAEEVQFRHFTPVHGVKSLPVAW